MPELVDQLWSGGGYGSRRDRAVFRFKAFVPDPIADWDRPLAPRAADAVAEATAALVRLQSARAVPDLESLATALLRAEALGSSFIEGLRASNRRLALATYEPRAADVTARAVLGNVRAMEQAIAIGSANRRFQLDDLLDIHRALLDGTTEERFAGAVRTDQNWIGGRGTSPRDASFVPPPPDRVPGLLDDLLTFCNLDDLPAVAQAAVAHAQFETIHPFGDGNGRTGRCLIHVILRRRGVADHVVPPISAVLAAGARRYVAGLTDFQQGRVDDWIGLFATAVTAAASATTHLSSDIDDLLEDLLVRAGQPRSGSVARRIVGSLPAHPIVSADSAAQLHGVTPTAARMALNRLEEAGVLVPVRVGRHRNREWMSDELFQRLDEFEFLLGESAATRSGRRPAPSPTAPPRPGRGRAQPGRTVL